MQIGHSQRFGPYRKGSRFSLFHLRHAACARILWSAPHHLLTQSQSSWAVRLLGADVRPWRACRTTHMGLRELVQNCYSDNNSGLSPHAIVFCYGLTPPPDIRPCPVSAIRVTSPLAARTVKDKGLTPSLTLAPTSEVNAPDPAYTCLHADPASRSLLFATTHNTRR